MEYRIMSIDKYVNHNDIESFEFSCKDNMKIKVKREHDYYTGYAVCSGNYSLLDDSVAKDTFKYVYDFIEEHKHQKHKVLWN